MPRLYNGDLANTKDVEAMGYKVMICGSTIWLIYKQLMAAFEELKETGRGGFRPGSAPAGTWRTCWAWTKFTNWSGSTAPISSLFFHEGHEGSQRSVRRQFSGLLTAAP